MKTRLSLLVFWLAGCTVSPMSEDGLKKFISDKDNGLYKSVEKEGGLVEVMYRPKDLVIKQQLDGNDPAQVEELRKKMDSLDYFVVMLSKNGREMETKYAGDGAMVTKAIDYLSFGIEKNLFLVHRADTFRTANFAYARMFATSTSSSMLVVFKSNLKSKDGKFLVCLDDDFLGTGFSSIEFNTRDIKDIPPLKF